MELRHLRYLVAIADAGTFVRAAEHLRVAQPALTRQIHDLEKELGVELFDSQARKATLTPPGDACVRLARHVIQDTEQAVSRARLSNSGVAGTCVLLAGPIPLTSGLVAKFVERLHARYPGISLELRESVYTMPWRAIADAEVDVGLGVSPSASYPSLLVETQYVHALDQAVLPANHALATRESILLEELRDLPLLMIEDVSPDVRDASAALTNELRRRSFPDSSVTPRQFPSFESVLAHVRAGQGWSIVPARLAGRLPGLVTVTLSDFRAPFRTMRMWRRSDTRPVIQTVLRELRAMQEQEGMTDEPRSPRAPSGSASESLPPRIDLRHLRSYVAVAKHGSLGRAAEALDLTQPALSRQMRELEYDVGVSLLDRKTRGMDLTSAGQVFVGDAKSVLAIVDHIPRELKRATRSTAQRCVIGCVPHPYVERIVAQVMSDLEGRKPRVRVGVRHVPTPAQAEALGAGEIDVGIGHFYPVPAPLPVLKTLMATKLFEDRICMALLGAKHPLAASASLSLRDLVDVPLLWGSRRFFPRFYDAIFERLTAAGVGPRIDAEYDGLTTMWSMVAQGLGWSLGWQSHRDAPPPGAVAIPLRDFSMEWGGELVYRQDESRAPVLATIDAIVAHARELYHTVSASDAVLPASNTSEAAIS